MWLILVVEYCNRGILLRANTNFDIERAMMRENLIRFHLAYSFLLLKNLLLDQIGMVGKTNKAQDLIYSSTSAFTNNAKL